MKRTQINPRKLQLSKWTAVSPQQREKHFIITRLRIDERGQVTLCELQAVLSRRRERIDWQVLEDRTRWQPGWL